MVPELTIAVAKGRLQDEALTLLAAAGAGVSSQDLSSRRLAVEDESGQYRFIFVKPAHTRFQSGSRFPIFRTGFKN